jgi:DNA-binding response OmpR family regulator
VGARILVVDSDPDLATLYTLLFTRAGYAVQWADDLGTLQAFVSAPAARRPDLVVLDPRLPDGDGSALCRALKARWPGLPVVALAAAPAARAAVLADCVDACLVKPVDAAALAATVARLLGAASR